MDRNGLRERAGERDWTLENIADLFAVRCSPMHVSYDSTSIKLRIDGRSTPCDCYSIIRWSFGTTEILRLLLSFIKFTCSFFFRTRRRMVSISGWAVG